MSQHVSITTPDLRAMSQPATIDPDISATLSDFLTYTEHLPSAVVRSMTLIETLNKKAAALQKQMHDLLTTYSMLPTMAADHGPDPVGMRRDISHAYDKLEECKRMSAAEAARIEDMVTRDARRLQLVSQKLKALPMPPSRDATPEPVPVPVPSEEQLKRRGQSLTQPQQLADKRVAAHRTTTAPRVRNRDKLMVPGEVLPPPNPDSPPPSEPDDWPELSTPPIDAPDNTPRQKSVARQRTPKPPRPPKADIPRSMLEASSKKEPGKEPNKDKPQKTPRARPPGMPGTNAHSAVAGISTSNAIMALTKPPTDAVVGSKWLPWKALTEYELATLRKKMKKNAAWKPSPAMKNRELKDRGRGSQAMEEAKADADARGIEFIDVDLDTWVDPTKTVVSGEQQAEMNAILGPEKDHLSNDETMINRGMRLNEAKKLKREKQKADEIAMNDKPSIEQPPEPQKPDAQEPVKKPTKPKPAPVQPEPSEKPPAKPDPPPQDAPKPAAQPKVMKPPPPPAPPVEHVVEKDMTEPDPPAPPVENTAKKRKRDPTPPAPPVSQKPAVEPSDVPPIQRAAPERKKLKLNPPAPPLPQPPTSDATPAVASPKPTTPADPPPRTSARSRSQRTSAAPTDPPLLPPPTTRSGSSKTGTTITLKRAKAHSEEPLVRKYPRRDSNASLPGGSKRSQSPAPKKEAAASRRSRTPRQSIEPTSAATRPKRRPAPGVVAAQEDGSATVSIGKRKKPPVKKQAQQSRGTSVPKKEEAAASAPEEEIDPNEERYCICGDVSWGPMICCDHSPNVSFSPFFFSLLLSSRHRFPVFWFRS